MQKYFVTYYSHNPILSQFSGRALISIKIHTAERFGTRYHLAFLDTIMLSQESKLAHMDLSPKSALIIGN